MNHSIATTAAAADAWPDDASHDEDVAFQEFQSEIARMSQDTDAILDSIRQAANPTPPAGAKRTKRSLAALIEMQKKADQQHRRGGDHTDTDDDDMTDDGSVPEEVRKQIADELHLLDTKFSTDPAAVSEEIRQVSQQGSFSPAASSRQKSDTSTAPIIMFDRDENLPRFFLHENNIFLAVILVWALVAYILTHVYHHGLLGEQGFIVLPTELRSLMQSSTA